MALQAPSLLAQLPRPLGGSTGKCRFSEVYSLAGGKKRKRYEVAAAIDGESVNIYSVQFPKLISSYAIPPQSSLSCPPCSVREKSAETSIVKRYTYCAVDKPERQIKCFAEEFGASDRSTAKFSTSVFALDDCESPAVFMTVIPTSQSPNKQDEAFDLIVVHENGQVRRLSSDMKTQRWNILRPANELLGDYHVHAGFVVSFEDAQKVLFKKRQDLVASILGAGHGIRSDSSTILMLVLHPRQSKTFLPSEVAVHLFSIPVHSPTNYFIVDENQRLRHLLKMKLADLPGQTPLVARNVNWSANLNQAELSLSFDQGYISYNLSHYTPEVDSHMIVANASFSSVMRISPRSVMGANQSTVSLYDAKYRSLQADLPVTELPQINSNKQAGIVSSLEYITYFSKLSLVVAVCGSALLAFDLAIIHNWGDMSRKRQRTGFLIDSIGKGIGGPDSDAKRPALDSSSLQFVKPLGLTNNGIADDWAEVKSELDSASKANEPAKFDQIMKAKFWKSLNPSLENPKGFPSAKDYVDPERVSFLLSKIFSLVTEGDSDIPKLTIRFLPFETFQWLVGSRHLSMSNIQIALRSSNPDRILPAIPDGSLVQALAQSGRSVKVLLLVLRSSVHFETIELGHALKLLLDVARSHSSNSAEPPKALTESPQKQNPGTAKEVTPVTSKQSPSAEAVLTDAVSGLNLTLLKLHSHPLDKVTRSIRSVLSNSDILSIIHHLRHSLATSGYTSRFTEDAPPSFASPKIPLLPLSAIVDLLNACIDAVGPSGWISAAGFAGAEGSEVSLVAEMKSEVSAALAGVEEATYLKGILREFIRCCETAKDISQRQPSKRARKQSRDVGLRIKRTEQVNGAKILVYDKTTDQSGLLNTDTKILPLSLKMTGQSDDAAGEEPSKTKVVKSTGEVKKRTFRDIGYLKAHFESCATGNKGSSWHGDLVGRPTSSWYSERFSSHMKPARSVLFGSSNQRSLSKRQSQFNIRLIKEVKTSLEEYPASADFLA
ncbi:predicted protein [Uncinocarpus reesii 1704]|uniref:Utp8 beta-propeller domain-containing protein n=1 Tax=Uncinocarpus reesii (strain UAMH 1704) TaxID=336963 RepID=C4JUW6_UNCRE|nr:uncharacterized protein UREG_04919 [Uncinocarpus reesii 1704]EEP80077.1 predicted protein [Uncinocarpus reesii 1704]